MDGKTKIGALKFHIALGRQVSQNTCQIVDLRGRDVSEGSHVTERKDMGGKGSG